MKTEKTYGRGMIKLNCWAGLKMKLNAHWGSSMWPVEWQDITPSIDVWMDEALEAKALYHRVMTLAEIKALVDKMFGHVLECVEILRKDGATR